MHTLLVVIAINLATFGFAFAFAGFLGLAPPTEAEAKAQRQAYERERARGVWYGFLESRRQMIRARSQLFSIMAAHWPERPQSRWLLCLGAVFLVVAVIIGYFLGTFS